MAVVVAVLVTAIIVWLIASKAGNRNIARTSIKAASYNLTESKTSNIVINALTWCLVDAVGAEGAANVYLDKLEKMVGAAAAVDRLYASVGIADGSNDMSPQHRVKVLRSLRSSFSATASRLQEEADSFKSDFRVD